MGRGIIRVIIMGVFCWWSEGCPMVNLVVDIGLNQYVCMVFYLSKTINITIIQEEQQKDVLLNKVQLKINNASKFYVLQSFKLF